MISEKQIERTLEKMRRFEDTLAQRIFVPVDTVSMRRYCTRERLDAIPDAALFEDCAPGDAWGGQWNYCWFLGEYTPPETLAGKTLYLYPKTTGYEALLWVDGEPFGVFAAKFIEQSHGNHYSDLLTMAAVPGKPLQIALEYYAGHYCVGGMPLIDEETRDFRYQVGSFDICVKDEAIARFLFDLKTVNQLVQALDANSFRRAQLVAILLEIFEGLFLSPDDADEAEFRRALWDAQPKLTEALSAHNSASAPFAGLIGHSHMDTAWLWTIGETVKKCARTYANQLALMEQYPEYKFVQSSAYHSEVIRRHYPGLFKRMQARVADGRYEPNGGVWVECDCNIVSGEMMARQFLWGQRFTREHFGYTSDAFWLPDTFGYSAAIPQIMRLSGVKYFLTTKINWNDTNDFPYDTFWWKGIDGTRVLAHFNKTHIWPDPKNLMEFVVNGKATGNCIQEKSVSNMRLLSFGYGDGGGGPQFEMLEMARRLEDLEGLPRASYTTVSEFMQRLEQTIHDPSTYCGELYLELHRGTLTNQHQIKRNNRLAEIALHNLEYFTVRAARERGAAADGAALRPLTETLLVNQFHDILPGTCIPEAHEQSLRETGELLDTAKEMTLALLGQAAAKDSVTVYNTLSFERDDTLYLEGQAGRRVAAGARQQRVSSLLRGEVLAVSGCALPAFASCALPLEAGEPDAAPSPFRVAGDDIETPFARIRLDADGYIASFRDKTAGERELCGEGYPFNTLLIAEDVPYFYDNWDIDADLEGKLRPVRGYLGREVVSDGCVELRIRSRYQLTAKSTLTQDMVFSADSPLVRFETRIDWQDHHRFLKAAFDTAVQATEARSEIQFGHVKRSTLRNTDLDKARFEVCNHKYTDLSETRYGVAVLNDCKYGVSLRESQIRLSLHKGGNRPDYKGDLGVHDCVYAFLPHVGGYSAASVVRPAYCLNYPHIVVERGQEFAPLWTCDAETVLCETVKPCESADTAFILRLYECEGAYAAATVRVPGAKSITVTDLLEDPLQEAQAGDSIVLRFRPFEIQTLRVAY